MTDETKPTSASAGTGVTEEPHVHGPECEHEHEHVHEEQAEKEGDKKEKLLQDVDMKDVGPCKKHITVCVKRSSIDRLLNEQFSKLRVEANVAGFRPGKTPRKIIERRFQKEVSEQVKGELLLQSLEQLADELEIVPLSPPNLNPFKIEIPKEGDLVYEFDVEVSPDITLPEYKGLKLKRPVKNFTDEDVAREKRHLLSEFSQLVPKTEGSTVEVGDLVVADVTSRDGDRVLNELKEFRTHVDKQLAFKDGVARKFAEQLKGAKVGEQRQVDITISSRAAEPSLQGKTVVATFEIKDLKTYRTPEMTTEFLGRNFGVRTEASLDEALRVLLSRRLEYQQLQSYREQIVNLLGKDIKWELPRDMLERQARKAFERRVMEMRSQGISDTEIEGRRRMLEQDVVRNTAQSLMEHFILNKVAELEEIDVSDDDIDDEIERIAATNNEPARRVRARIEKEDQLDVVAGQILTGRAMTIILGSAEWEEVPLEDDDDSTVATVEDQAVPGAMEELKKPEAELQAALAEQNKKE